MFIIKVAAQIALLEVFYLIGSAVARLLHVPIPGSIIGMLLLLAALLTKLCPLKWIETGSGLLLANLPLLFIPITVGVMNEYQVFAGSGIVLFFIALVSTAIVMLTSGPTSHFLAKRKEQRTCKERLSES